MRKRVWEYIREWGLCHILDESGRKIADVHWEGSSRMGEVFIVEVNDYVWPIYIAPSESRAKEFSQLMLALLDEVVSLIPSPESPSLPKDVDDLTRTLVALIEGRLTIAEGWSKLEGFISKMIEHHEDRTRHYQARALAYEVRRWLNLEINE